MTIPKEERPKLIQKLQMIGAETSRSCAVRNEARDYIDYLSRHKRVPYEQEERLRSFLADK